MGSSRPNRCIVCYAGLLRGGEIEGSKRARLEGLSKEADIKGNLIDQQTTVIFILRNILEIPIETVCELLGKAGENPGEWIKTCEKCYELIDKAREIFGELLKVQHRFRRVQEQIVRETSQSCLEYNGRNRKRGFDGDALWATDKCREIVKARIDTEDLKTLALVPKVTVKEEPIAEEESILPNDFEDANDWQEVLPESHSDEEWKPSRNTEKHKWRICGVSQKRNRQRVARKRKRAKVDKLLGSPVKSDLIQVSQENPVLGFSRKEFQQVLDKDYEISTGSKTSHLSLRNWQCSSCSEDGISSMTLPEFMDHYLYHIRYRFKCSRCSHWFSSDMSRDTHYHFKIKHPRHVKDNPSTRCLPKDKLPEIPWSCPVCEQEFVTDQERDSHVVQFHPEEDIELRVTKSQNKCNFCSSSYISLAELRLHQVSTHVYDERLKSYRARSSRVKQTMSAKKRQQIKEEIEQVTSSSEEEDDEEIETRQEETNMDQDLQSDSPGEESQEVSEVDLDLQPNSLEEEPQEELKDNLKEPQVELVDGYNKTQFQKLAKTLSKYKASKKRYSCQFCPDQEPLKLYNFLMHYLYHKRMRYKCSHCKHRFPSIESNRTLYHYRHHHPSRLHDETSTKCVLDPVLPEYLWKCAYCPDSLSTETLRTAHVAEMHQTIENLGESLPYRHNCRNCNQNYVTTEEYLMHVAQNHVNVFPASEQVFRCNFCDKTFPRKYQLSEHREKEHANPFQVEKKPPPRHNQHMKCLRCPLCLDYKTQNKGDKICQHLENCPKKLELEASNGGSTTENPIILCCTICNTFKLPLESKIELLEHMGWCQGSKDQDSETTSEITPLRSRIFKCTVCTEPKRYFKLEGFLRHYLYHSQNQYKCSECKMLFQSDAKCNSHFAIKHTHLTEKVPVSSRCLHDPSLPQFNWHCNYCNAPFPTDDLLETHIHANHANDTLPASSSNKIAQLPPVSTLSGELKLHRCVQCPKAYNHLAELKLHEVTAHLTDHSKPQQFSCTQCSETFVLLAHLRQHIAQKHDGNTTVCEHCGKVMKSENLKLHMQLHQKVRMFPCPEPGCEKSFNRKHMLTLHTYRNHTPKNPLLNPVACPHCPDHKTFGNRTYLQQHIRAVHLRIHATYCHICGKGQQSHSKLLRHLTKVHKIGNTGQYPCPEPGCGKIYYEKGTLKEHLTKHRGEPGLKCEFCQKPFYFRHQLRRHELIHRNAETKPYQCEICAKRFPVQGYLYIHMRSHKKKGEI